MHSPIEAHRYHDPLQPSPPDGRTIVEVLDIAESPQGGRLREAFVGRGTALFVEFTNNRLLREVGTSDGTQYLASTADATVRTVEAVKTYLDPEQATEIPDPLSSRNFTSASVYEDLTAGTVFVSEPMVIMRARRNKAAAADVQYANETAAMRSGIEVEQMTVVELWQQLHRAVIFTDVALIERGTPNLPPHKLVDGSRSNQFHGILTSMDSVPPGSPASIRTITGSAAPDPRQFDGLYGRYSNVGLVGFHGISAHPGQDREDAGMLFVGLPRTRDPNASLLPGFIVSFAGDSRQVGHNLEMDPYRPLGEGNGSMLALPTISPRDGRNDQSYLPR